MNRSRSIQAVIGIIAIFATCLVHAEDEPLEIFGVSPSTAEIGETIEIRIGTFSDSDIDVEAGAVVHFDGHPVKAKQIQSNRGGYLLIVEVPADVPPGSTPTIMVAVGNSSSNAYNGFRVAVDQLKVISVSPTTAQAGDVVMIRFSRQLVDSEKTSIQTRFHDQFAKVLAVGTSEIEVEVPNVAQAEPAITVLAGKTSLDPYFGFRVRGIVVTSTPAQEPIWQSWFARALGVLAAVVVLAQSIAVVVRRVRRSRTKPTASAPSPATVWEGGNTDLTEGADGIVPDVPEALAAACASGACAIYAGSGLGRLDGYPTWREFLNELSQTTDAATGNEVNALLGRDELNTATRVLIRALSEDLLTQKIRDRFRPNVKRGIDAPLAKIPFAFGFNTGFDDVLERAFGQAVVETSQSRTSVETLTRYGRTIYNLWGHIAEGDGPILTEDEYLFHIRENPSLIRFVEGAYLSQPFFFVGASLDNIEQFLSTFGISGAKAKHFALLPRIPAQTSRCRILTEEYGIEILFYTPTQGFPEVRAFLEDLSRQVEARAGDVDRASEKNFNLDKIVLENIGPFAHLELEVHDGWNVLLGTNGCGKSTILKAVALALCGEHDEVQSVGQSLLRIGENEGLIELHVGSQTFRTRIRKERRRITVKPEGVTPLESGKWLVMGFPALRAVSKIQIRGPSSMSDEEKLPDPNDVLPLLRSGLDTRMDGLKQWIVNTSVRGDDGSRGAERYRDLLQDLFRVMDDLTPKVPLKFGHLDRDTWEVWVETSDGDVPLSFISQGMSSIFAWAGCLLQRLFELHEDATVAHALVLVDELDAHMHPRWQQQIVATLKETLPNIQFICTTHSPLVVLSCEREEVFHARRVEDEEYAMSEQADYDNAADQTLKGATVLKAMTGPTKPEQGVVVERLESDLKGWYADQILTGPLFDLDTSGDLQLHEARERYAELSAMDQLSEADQQELAELSKTLDVRVPMPHEREEARLAFQAISASLEAELDKIPDERKRAAVFREARVQILQGANDEGRST